MNKNKKHIILRISNKGVFYNESDFLSWEATNFPPKKDFNFNDRNAIFWKAEMLSFRNNELAISIVDYDISSDKTFLKQQPNSIIKKLLFERLKWSELKERMNIYQQNLFNEISDAAAEFGDSNKQEVRDEQKIISDEKLTKIPIQIKYPLMKTSFKMGYVELTTKLKAYENPITIILENDHIIPEFDHIKPFFVKALGCKKIEIIGELTFDRMGNEVIRCHSKEINKINETLITSVKRLNLKAAIFNPKPIAVDKSLFSPEEYFEGTEETLGNTFNKENNKGVLKEILQLEGIRNKKQLTYLSGKLQNHASSLKFTLSPKFGFLFHVEGEEMNHFIWELLNTHATYIWSISKSEYDLTKKIKLLEQEINSIRNHGRRTYLNSIKISPSIFVFNKINHSSAGIIDGFPKWKMKVNEKLV